jgi:hypothetical protein
MSASEPNIPDVATTLTSTAAGALAKPNPAHAVLANENERPATDALDQSDGTVSTRPAHPTLRPGTEVRWRTDGTVLIGSRPGARVHGSTSELIGIVRALSGIDGTRSWSDIARRPLTEPLLLDLVRAGCIVDDPGSSVRLNSSAVDAARARVVDADADNPVAIASARRHARVVVNAPEPLGSALPQALGTAAVTIVSMDSRGAAPTLGLSAYLCEGSEPRLDAHACDTWLRQGVPHLTASIAGTRVRLSHLVMPGVSACLHCQALTADDRELTDLARVTNRNRADIPVRHRTALGPDVAALCVGLMLGRALAAIDGLSERISNEVVLDSTGRRESAQPVPHPNCGCRLL